jgi:hypothetical protein
MWFISFVERASAWRDEGRLAGEQDSSPTPFLPALDLWHCEEEAHSVEGRMGRGVKLNDPWGSLGLTTSRDHLVSRATSRGFGAWPLRSPDAFEAKLVFSSQDVRRRAIADNQSTHKDARFGDESNQVS